jgi:opacity protein-like surface antigen
MKINSIMAVMGLGSLLIVTPALAGFRVDKQPTNDPCGNIEIPCTRQATIRAPTLVDREYASLPERETNRWYGRMSLNFGSLRLKNIKNQSLGPNLGGMVAQKAHHLPHTTGLEFAVGYMGSRMFHGEFEYLVIRNFHYSADPILTKVAVQRKLDAEIKNSTFLYNTYLEATLYDSIKPFLTAGIGFAFNSAKSVLTPAPLAEGAGRITRTLGLAYQAGIGVRVRLLTRCFLSMNYRYIGLGQMRIRPNDTLRIKARYSMIPFSIGMSYLF